MSEPWGDNSRPDEGCGFCSDFQRMKDEPEVCEGCPHEPCDPHESGHIMVTPAYAESAARYGIHYPADWILPDDPVVET